MGLSWSLDRCLWGSTGLFPSQGSPVPSRGPLRMVCVAAGPVPGALQGTPFLGNSSGERFLPEVNGRTPFALFCTGRIQGFVFLCIFGHPKFFPGSVEVLLGLWGLGSHCWIPGWILALELESKKGFGWPPVALSPLDQPLVAAGCVPKAQGRSWKCFLWFLWPLAADLGDFHPRDGGFSSSQFIPRPRDVAAPWDTARGCRKGCRKLLLRLVLPWNVGRALGLSLFWVIPGNPGCSCFPCAAEGWEFPGLFLSSQGSPWAPGVALSTFPPPGMCFLSEHSR